MKRHGTDKAIASRAKRDSCQAPHLMGDMKELKTRNITGLFSSHNIRGADISDETKFTLTEAEEPSEGSNAVIPLHLL